MWLYHVQIQNKILNIDQAELINVIENEWFNTIIINFEHPTNIKSAEEILSIVLEKQDINTLESINLINANITDNEWNIFSLSTSWIEF